MEFPIGFARTTYKRAKQFQEMLEELSCLARGELEVDAGIGEGVDAHTIGLHGKQLAVVTAELGDAEKEI